MSETIPGSPTEGRVVRDGDLRAQVYDVALALTPLLVLLGLVSPEQAQLWLGLAAALIPLAATLLARLNVARKGRHAADD